MLSRIAATDLRPHETGQFTKQNYIYPILLRNLYNTSGFYLFNGVYDIAQRQTKNGMKATLSRRLIF